MIRAGIRNIWSRRGVRMQILAQMGRESGSGTISSSKKLVVEDKCRMSEFALRINRGRYREGINLNEALRGLRKSIFMSFSSRKNFEEKSENRREIAQNDQKGHQKGYQRRNQPQITLPTAKLIKNGEFGKTELRRDTRPKERRQRDVKTSPEVREPLNKFVRPQSKQKSEKRPKQQKPKKSKKTKEKRQKNAPKENNPTQKAQSNTKKQPRFYLIDTVSLYHENRRFDRHMKEKFKISWKLVQRLTRTRKLRIIRHEDPSEPSKYTQYFEHNTELKKGDKIVISKEELSKVSMERAQTLRMPFFFKDDDFYERNLEFSRSLILGHNDEFLVVGKDHGMNSQPGTNTKMDLYFLFNTFLYDLNQKRLGVEEAFLRGNWGDGEVSDPYEEVIEVGDEAEGARNRREVEIGDFGRNVNQGENDIFGLIEEAEDEGRDSEDLFRERKCHIVHRLDQGTSGAMLVALNPRSASELSGIIRRRELVKTYVAFAAGLPSTMFSGEDGDLELDGTLKTWMWYNYQERRAEIEIIDEVSTNPTKKGIKRPETVPEGAEIAETGYKIEALIVLTNTTIFYFKASELEENPEKLAEIISPTTERTQGLQYDIITVYSLDLKTGKKHQIRAHLADCLATPILFDTRYGFQDTLFQLDKLKSLCNDFPKILKKRLKLKFGGQEDSIAYKSKVSTLELDSLEWFFLHSRRLRFLYKNELWETQAEYSDHIDEFFRLIGLQDEIQNL